jgi:hypothetical protein
VEDADRREADATGTQDRTDVDQDRIEGNHLISENRCTITAAEK